MGSSKHKSEQQVVSRRTSLRMAGAAILSLWYSSARSDESSSITQDSGDGELVKLITADGRVVEAPRSQIRNTKRRRANNRTLLNWISGRS